MWGTPNPLSRTIVTSSRGEYGALDVVRLHAEGGVLEVLAQVVGLQPGRRVDEVLVHRELSSLCGGLAPDDRNAAICGQLAKPLAPGGRDVAEAPAVVGAVRLHLGMRRGRSECEHDHGPCQKPAH